MDADLVQRRKRGRNQLYVLRADPLERAYAWLSRYQEFWRARLKALKDHVEESPE